MIKKVLVGVLVAALLSFLIGGTALATTPTPHGPFEEDTDLCSACHRLHTGVEKYLLNMLTTDLSLCLSCHNAASGADTQVKQGQYITAKETGHTWGTDEGVLLGGGFDYVGGTDAATSKHDVGVAGVPWGAEDITVTINLTCISCHSPHRSTNYRILRMTPNNVATVTVQWRGKLAAGPDGVLGDDPLTPEDESQDDDYRFYTEEDLDASTSGIQGYTLNYRGVAGSTGRNGISTWCAGCHTKYLTWEDTAGYNAGDAKGAVKRFRHKVDVDRMYLVPGETSETELPTTLPLEDLTGNGRTSDDEVTCLTCHKAHGTAATMTGYADALSERGTMPQGSMLLRMVNRGVCEDCHNMPSSGW